MTNEASMVPAPPPDDLSKLAELEARFEALESRVELEGANKLRDAHTNAVNQQIALSRQGENTRQAVAFFAAFVVFVSAILLGVDVIFIRETLRSPQENPEPFVKLYLAMFLAPIVSITTIVVIMLTGAFKSSKEAASPLGVALDAAQKATET